MLETQLTIAMIGAGGISRAHSSGILQHPEKFKVKAVCDVHQPSAQQLADELGEGIAIYDSPDAMLEECGGDIRAVILCTPHFLHLEVTKRCLKMGLACLVEKPVVCSVEELEQLRPLETDTAFVQVGQMQRFGREAAWMRELVMDEAKFGKPMSFDINEWVNIRGYIRGNTGHWILDKEKAGGGVCISFCIHALDMLRYLTGQDFTQVTAVGAFDAPYRNGAESACSALFKMSGGLTGTLHANSMGSRLPYMQRISLIGQRGTLYEHAEAGRYEFDCGDPNIEGWGDMFTEFQSVPDAMPSLGPDEADDSYTRQLLAFRESALAGQRPSENTLELNFNTIAVLDAIAESMQSGQPTAVQQIS